MLRVPNRARGHKMVTLTPPWQGWESGTMPWPRHRRALAAGLSAHAVAALLGHLDAGLVLRRYGHALPDELARAGEALSAWRKGRAGGA